LLSFNVTVRGMAFPILLPDRMRLYSYISCLYSIYTGCWKKRVT